MAQMIAYTKPKKNPHMRHDKRSLSLYEELNVPIPSRLPVFSRSESLKSVSNKLDIYFDDIIRNYPIKTQEILKRMYYDNENVRVLGRFLYWQGIGGLAEVKDAGKHYFAHISHKDMQCPVFLRLTKIHEIAVHIGQFHQRISQVGYELFSREHTTSLHKFT